MTHLKKQGALYLLFVVMLVVIVGYYWIAWGTFPNFLAAIDHHTRFMEDFAEHYYPMSRQILSNPAPVEGYFYTSFFALLLTPIGRLNLLLATIFWGFFQMASLAGLIIVSTRLLKLSPLETVLSIGLCLLSFPIIHNITWGQVSILLTTCVIAAFLLTNKNRHLLAGALLAFASAIKFYPLVFLVYFLLKRDIQMVVAFGLTALILYLIIPSTILGFSPWFNFEQAIWELLGNTSWVKFDPNSQYIVHVGLRWFEKIFDKSASDGFAQLSTVVGYLVSLSCIYLAWLFQRQETLEGQGLSSMALFLSIPFWMKTSWPHYFVYLPFCQTATLSYCVSSYRESIAFKKMAISITMLSMILSSILVFNLFENWTGYNSNGLLFFSNALILIVLYLLAFQKQNWVPSFLRPTSNNQR